MAVVSDCLLEAELIEEPEDGEDVNHHPATENLIPPKAFMLNGGNEKVLFSIGDLNTEQRSRGNEQTVVTG